jgi:hypothetical protein
MPPVAARLPLYDAPDVAAEGDRFEIVSFPTGTTVTSADELLAPPAMGKLTLPARIVVDVQAGSVATFVAVIVTLVEDATVGAVNRPLSVIEPALACHTTAVFGVDVRVATNCCLAPEEIVALEGESAILTEGLGVDVVGVDDGAMPPQPVEMQASAERKSAIPKCLETPLDADFS